MCHDELMRNRPQPIKPSAKCMQLTTCPACILPGAKPPAGGLRQPAAPAQTPEEALLRPDTAMGRGTGGEGQRPPGCCSPPGQHSSPSPGRAPPASVRAPKTHKMRRSQAGRDPQGSPGAPPGTAQVYPNFRLCHTALPQISHRDSRRALPFPTPRPWGPGGSRGVPARSPRSPPPGPCKGSPDSPKVAGGHCWGVSCCPPPI